ncbi:ABC transporter permease [Puniceicoccaceae bacterium K14]|nr:ABC transporter permease [Puniceicoccaceae bacterium K14]
MLRHWCRNWLKLLATCLVVSLAAGLYIAIDIANKATVSSFESFTDQITGSSDITLTSSSGNLSLQDIASVRKILINSETELFPVFESNIQVASPNTGVEQLLVIGLDFYALLNHVGRSETKEASSKNDDLTSSIPVFRETMDTRNGFYCDASTAASNDWQIGQEIAFIVNSQKLDLKYLGSFPTNGEKDLSSRVIVVDARKFANILDQDLTYDRLELLVSDLDSEHQILDILSENKAKHWIVETQRQRKSTGESMTQALRMNLRALSTLSLIVAAFLVFQALDSSVVKRHKEFAILHSLGSPRWISKLLWLSESLLIGIIGGGLGIILGNLLGRLSTGMVSQTVDTLYYFSNNSGATISKSDLFSTWGIVIAVCSLAGWFPAKLASKMPPAQLIRQDSKQSNYKSHHYWFIAATSLALSIVGYLLPPLKSSSGHSIPVGGYLLVIALIGFFVSIAVLCLGYLGSSTPFLSRFDLAAKLGVSQLRNPVTRHRLALGGVTVAVGMTAAMIILIASFEMTVKNWIGNILQADLYIRSKASGSLHSDARMSAKTVQGILYDQRISNSSTIYSGRIRYDGLYTTLTGYDFKYASDYNTLSWFKAPMSPTSLFTPGYAVISESFQERFSKSVGDFVRLEFPDQTAEFQIIGVYADYGNEQGSIGISQESYKKYTADNGIRGLALHLNDSSQIEHLATELEEKFPSLSVVTNKWLREETLRIFNSVFSVTYALKAAGLFISVAGLGSMVFSLLLERFKQVGALRMIGVSGNMIRRAAIWESAAIAAFGSLAGILLGQMLGLVLIYIINKQSFGWTLQFTQPITQLIILCAGIILSTALVAYVVANRILKQPIEREE